MNRPDLRFHISKRELVSTIADVIVDMAPDNRPYLMDTILSKITDKIAELETTPVKFTNNSGEAMILQSKFNPFLGGFYIFVFCERKISISTITLPLAYYFVNSIPEIRALNISMAEREAGIVDPDDPRRSRKSRITTIYDKSDRDTWKNDFIDLDALAHNLSEAFNSVGKYSDGVVDENTIQTRKKHYPRGNVQTVCSLGCPIGKYICCAECKSKETCNVSCDNYETYKTCEHLLCETHPKKESEDEA